MSLQHDRRREVVRADVLLVEDNPGDVFLLRQALAQLNRQVTLHVTEDGEAGLAFLRKEDPYRCAPRPDFVVLDLNLPKKDGHEVLSEIKTDPRFRAIPVVILTGSEADEDIVEAYDAGANIYMIKPDNPDTLSRLVEALESIWFVLGRLPPK